eukprot:TRINITY_DN639_c0_g1_i2.p2 TRINITY_DN639_c0_g1~~TRINITY_DN639_c0_g1_i2.p2  ORF type:complete len:325 (-),score=29.64 TRINITY_DN639_c0_g1_i2:237-1211(-)
MKSLLILLYISTLSIQENLASQRDQQEKLELFGQRGRVRQSAMKRKLLQTDASPEDNQGSLFSSNETGNSGAFKGSGVSDFMPFETIVDEDDRQYIYNTYDYPYSTVGKLEFRCQGGLFSCTGTLVGPATVLTAAHCIYKFDQKEECYDFTFSPGRQRDYEPFGKVEAYDWYYPYEWEETGKLEYDYGVIELWEDIGYEAGWMDYGYDCKDTVQDLETAGYPRDKDPFNNAMYGTECYGQALAACSCKQWRNGNCVQRGQTSNLFGHTCDTISGQSGSPMWTYLEPDYPIVRAIHSSGSTVQNQPNTAVIINREVFDFIDYYYY